MLSVHQIVNTPVTSNCYILFDKETSEDCIIIDPGSKDETELLTFLRDKELSPKFIILTHEHFDHCWGVNLLIELYHVPVVCSELCADAIHYDKRNCSLFYDNKEAFTINTEAISIESIGNKLPFAGRTIRFLMTPGHTDASICFLIGKFLFTGDTLIKDERTVTKLPTGAVSKLRETVRMLEGLKGEDYTVCPGHGELFGLDGYSLFLSI